MSSTFWNRFGTQSNQSITFLEGLLAPLCIYDLWGKILFVSPNLQKILQADTETLDFFNYFPPRSLELAPLHDYWQRARAGEHSSFTCHLLPTQTLLKCSLQFLADEQRMVLVAEQVHQPLLTPEASILKLLNRVNVAIALTYPNGTVYQCNQQFQALLRIQACERLNLESFVHPDDQGLDHELRQSLLRGEIESYTTEKRIITSTGDTIWANFSVFQISIPSPDQRETAALAVVLEDVTESHNLYEALVRTEEKWKTFVLNSAHLFLQLSDIGRILYVSPAVERTLGYQEEELLDRSVVDLIHHHDLADFRTSFQRWLEGDTTAHSDLECRWKSKSGKWMYLYVQGQRFPLALEIEGIAISGYNISDRKHLEIALRDSEKKLRSLTAQTPWNGQSNIRNANVSPDYFN